MAARVEEGGGVKEEEEKRVGRRCWTSQKNPQIGKTISLVALVLVRVFVILSFSLCLSL